MASQTKRSTRSKLKENANQSQQTNSNTSQVTASGNSQEKDSIQDTSNASTSPANADPPGSSREPANVGKTSEGAPTRAHIAQMMESQTQLFLSEMNKIMYFNQESMKFTMKENITTSSAQISESLGNQLKEISTSLGSLENRMASMETSMNLKITEIKRRMDSYDSKLQNIVTDQKTSKGERADFDAKLSALKSAVHENKQSISNLYHEKKISDSEYQQAIAFRDQELKESQNRILELEKANEGLQKKIETVGKSVFQSTKSCKKQHMDQDAKIDLLDSKSRKNNLIIDGVHETSDENLEQKILDLINAANCKLQNADIHAIFRYGSAKGNKPRPIMVTFSSPKVKDIVIYNIREIKKKSANKHLWFNKDQADTTRRRISLVKRCHALCRKHKYEATLKGETITLDGINYKYSDLTLLPEKCRPEDTKMAYTEDGTGVGFHSEHVYLSNFYPCKVEYEGRIFSSAEQAFQFSKLISAGYTKLANEVMVTDNPHEQKQTGGKITPTEAWYAGEVEVLKNIVQNKFEQNDLLKKRLMTSPYSNFYEMTTSLKWATGVATINTNKPLTVTSFKGENHHGQILKELKEKLLAKQQ